MFIADFHIHSKYSRATSRDCVPEKLDLWARRKGIGVVGTGDFTHRVWREELKEKLILSEDGLYTLKDEFHMEDEAAGTDLTPRFIVSGEISSIYKKNGKVRKVHNLIILPGLEEADKLALRLEAIGNLHSDGRPILGLDSRDLLEIALEICPEVIFIPAHIWTPHFSLYGAYSGFDHIEECFGDLTEYIYALETGLSSDPPMNWRLSALDGFTLVSNSDAHSPGNIAREANIFKTGLAYQNIWHALKNRNSDEFFGTIEFFPEEGKYHYDGHRNCKASFTPAETIAAGGVCPVCGGRITLGVLHRVEALADREEGARPPAAKHYESLVPLNEVIAASIGFTVNSRKVKDRYEDLLRNLGGELFILREASLKDIELAAGPAGPQLAEGIRRLREGRVEIEPGYDGEYGKIKILKKSEMEELSGQLSFFGADLAVKEISGKDAAEIENNGEVAAKAETAGADAAGAGPVGAVHAGADPTGTDTSEIDPTETDPAGSDPSRPDPVEAGVAESEIYYGLNEEQWEAVSSLDPAIAIIAGPGTGKTKTLVSRIAYLVERQGVNPRQISAVTFTNKAAAEMRRRLKEHFTGRGIAEKITIGTFHGICLQMLSKQRERVVIIDEYEAGAIIEELLKETGLKISTRQAGRAISLLKNGKSQPEKRASQLNINEIYDAYCSRLKEYGVMDYDDILLEALDLFEKNEQGIGGDGSSGDGNSFSYLLVDEFQDINEIQYRLLQAWSRGNENIFVIGDPDQAIYGFRGSDSRFFTRFQQDFSVTSPIRLTKNYRSTPQIISAAVSLLTSDAAAGRRSSSVSASSLLQSIRGAGAAVRLVEAESEFSEALFITKEINRLVGGIDMLAAGYRKQQLSSKKKPPTGKPTAAGPVAEHTVIEHQRGFSEMAVLYRTNRQAEMLEQCFLKEGIPYLVTGREDFMADKLVQEALAFFRFLLNPGDLLSLRATLRSRGNLSPDLQQLQTKYSTMIKTAKPAETINSWIKDNNLAGVKSMEQLAQTAVMYDHFNSFLHNILLGQESDLVRSGSKEYLTDAVTLMTMHGAKGLEFPLVFLCGLREGLIPLKIKSDGSSGSDASGGSGGDNGSWIDNIDEERRLLYVGMTRAKDELILVTSGKPSVFLSALPPEELSREKPATGWKKAKKIKQTSLFD